MPGALITVVGFGRMSALSTRLAAALPRKKTAEDSRNQDTHHGDQHPVSMTSSC